MFPSNFIGDIGYGTGGNVMVNSRLTDLEKVETMCLLFQTYLVI